MAQAVSAQASDREAAGSISVSAVMDVRVDSITDPLTLAELRDALSKAKKNKSPRTDGIPYEFYTQFWESIAPHFLAMVHGVLDKEKLLPSQGRAAIRLLPKVPNPKILGLLLGRQQF